MDTIAMTRRFDLTDAQRAGLEPLLPEPTKSGRPSEWTKRQLIDGIRWRVRVGAPWRDILGTDHIVIDNSSSSAPLNQQAKQLLATVPGHHSTGSAGGQ